MSVRYLKAVKRRERDPKTQQESYRIYPALAYACKEGQEPWFMKPIFMACIVIKHSGDNASADIRERKKITDVLVKVPGFLAAVQTFWGLTGQPADTLYIDRLVNHYFDDLCEDKSLADSPYHFSRYYEIARIIRSGRGGLENIRGAPELLKEEWFITTIHDAFAEAIRANPGGYKKVYAASENVIAILKQDAAFMESAKKFFADNHLLFNDGSVAVLVNTYTQMSGEEIYNADKGRFVLKQLMEAVKPRPFSEEDTNLVYNHLRAALSEGNFATPQSASARVSISLRDAGHAGFTERKVRQIITHEARVDYARFLAILSGVNPDAREEEEGPDLYGSQLSRRPSVPTGDIGSTQKARRREPNVS